MRWQVDPDTAGVIPTGRGTKHRQATLRHEHGHAVDAAAGKKGKWLSNNPDFRRRYRRDVVEAINTHINHPNIPDDMKAAFTNLREQIKTKPRLTPNPATAN